jgi:predicted RNA-binding protein with PUA-like domain
MPRRYWLMKSEPTTFSFADLLAAPGRTTFWDGVRNFQARNYLRDDVKVGDGVLFYHSSTAEPAIVGRAKVVKDGYPDPSQWDPKSDHYDATANRDEPRWYMVDIQADGAIDPPLTLTALKASKGLDGMVLLQKGSRLSVQPVTDKEWALVEKLGGAAADRGSKPKKTGKVAKR